jgi:hypothetical protein
MKTKILAGCICLFLYSCKVNKVEKYMDGFWIVDSAYYNNETVEWDLNMNGFILLKNKTCTLPYNDYIYTDSCMYGKWKVHNDNGIIYLKIKTHNILFNKDFKINNLKIIKSNNPHFYKCSMELEADSMKLSCTKSF